MSETRFKDLVTGVMAALPSAPEYLVVKALRKAASDFYQETWAWRQYLPEFTTQEVDGGTRVALLTAPAATVALAVVRLEANKDLPGWEFVPPRDLVFDRPLAGGIKIKPFAALMPSHDANGVPQGHASLYLDVWEHGAIWYMRQQHGREWYEPNDGEYHRNLFRAGIVDARRRSSSGNRGGAMMVRPRPFM